MALTASRGATVQRRIAITRLSAPALAVTFASLFAGATFAIALVLRHRSYHSAAFDLAFFDQIVWNTSQGRWFETTFVPYNFAGQHFEPILTGFAALYRIAPGPETLLAVQAVALSAATIPLYLSGKTLLRSNALAAAFAASFLLLPQVHGAVLFDFHPEVMAPGLLFSSLAFAVRGRMTASVVALGATLLLKEDMALAVIGFATVYWHLGYRRLSAQTMMAAVLYLVFVSLLMAVIRGGATSDLMGRYAYLPGDSPADWLLSPLRVANQFITGGAALATFAAVASMAGLPLLSAVGTGAIPALLLNGLTSHPEQAELTLHYGIVPIVMLTMGALLGLARLSQCLRSKAATLSAVAAGVAFIVGSPLGPVQFDPSQYEPPQNADIRTRAIALIPHGASVSAQSGMLPHLSERREAYEFPDLRDAQFVLVDRGAWRSQQSIAAGFEETLEALPSLGYCPMLLDSNVELYRRCIQ